MAVQLAKENKNSGRGMGGRGMSCYPNRQGTNKDQWLEIYGRSDHELRLVMSFARRFQTDFLDNKTIQHPNEYSIQNNQLKSSSVVLTRCKASKPVAAGKFGLVSRVTPKNDFRNGFLGYQKM
jgi:hypothetical protein